MKGKTKNEKCGGVRGTKSKANRSDLVRRLPGQKMADSVEQVVVEEGVHGGPDEWPRAGNCSGGFVEDPECGPLPTHSFGLKAIASPP